jgi:hypothetical protein
MLEAYLKQATEYIAADFASRIKDKGVTISFVRPYFEQYQHIIKMYIRKARGTKWHILLLQ